MVRGALTAAAGPAAAAEWLDYVLEVAEVHVHPDFQAPRDRPADGGRPSPRAAAERTAVLSTQDASTPARRLYRSLGFTDLLTGFLFPGGGPPYAVMGAVLPLAGSAGRG